MVDGRCRYGEGMRANMTAVNTSNVPATIERPMTRDQAAEYLGVSRITLACWAARGTGPAYSRSGAKRGRVWYRAADLDRWLQSRSIEPTR
jgi:excisionase family DNA binding protein